MINLLPPQQKEAFQKQALVNKISLAMGFVLVSFLMLICFFLIFSSYIASQAAPGIEKIEMVQEFFHSEQFGSLREGLQQTNQRATQVRDFLALQPSVAAVLDTLDLVLPPGIYFQQFTFTKKEDKQAEVHISGKAPTREKLFLFKQNLEAEPIFSNVQFQLSSWIKPLNADFSLTFSTAVQ